MYTGDKFSRTPIKMVGVEFKPGIPPMQAQSVAIVRAVLPKIRYIVGAHFQDRRWRRYILRNVNAGL